MYNTSNDPVKEKSQTDYFRLSFPSTRLSNKSLLVGEGEKQENIHKVVLEGQGTTIPSIISDSGSSTTNSRMGHRQGNPLVLPQVSPSSPRALFHMPLANASTIGQGGTHYDYDNDEDDDEHRHKHKHYTSSAIPTCSLSTTNHVSSTAATTDANANDSSTFATSGGNNKSLFPPPPPPHSSSCQNSSHLPVPGNIQEEIPYISVDGRRKRRRTTFEDAFHQCLSMTMHEDSGIATATNSDNISTPERDVMNDSMYVDDDDNDDGDGKQSKDHDDDEEEDDDDDEEEAKDWNGHMTQGYYSSPRTKLYENVGEISKKLSYYPQEDDHDQNTTSNTSHLVEGGSTWKNSCKVSRMSSTDSLPDENHDLDEASISSSSTKSADHDSTNDGDYDDNDNTFMEQEGEERTSSLLPPPPISSSLLLAPRKVKKHSEYVDPVDQRIEELIRHSRIKAMVMTQRELDRQRQQQRAYEKCKMQQRGEKEMDHGESGGGQESMDVGGGFELRRKNEQEESYFTGQSTDDSVLPPWRKVGGSNLSTSSTSTASNIGTSFVGEGGLRLSRSNSIPRGMKYSEFMDVEMSDG